MKTIRLTAVAVLLAVSASAALLINESFDGGTLGGALASNLTTVVAGSGAIGPDNVADLKDNSLSGASYLEYNAGASAPGAMYIAFDLLNINPLGGTTASNAMSFGVGLWNDTTGYKLNSGGTRAFGFDIYHDGTVNNLRLRRGSSSTYTTTYIPTNHLSFKIWVNDNDTSTLSYIRPDTLATATLGADSYVVYMNDVLIGATEAGYTNQFTVSAGNAVLGRLGFYTASTTISEFQIDNLYVNQIPEPASVGLLFIGCATVLLVRRYRG